MFRLGLDKIRFLKSVFFSVIKLSCSEYHDHSVGTLYEQTMVNK